MGFKSVQLRGAAEAKTLVLHLYRLFRSAGEASSKPTAATISHPLDGTVFVSNSLSPSLSPPLSEISTGESSSSFCC